jgi:hypothetical protein
MKSVKMSLAAGGLLVAVFLLNVGAASACTFNCVRVAGGGPACKQCLDTGIYTGSTCQNSGPCGCFFTHNTCTPPGRLQASTDLSAITQADSVNACSTPSKADTGLPAALLQ